VDRIVGRTVVEIEELPVARDLHLDVARDLRHRRVQIGAANTDVDVTVRVGWPTNTSSA
jgi:hypothetical protein